MAGAAGFFQKILIVGRQSERDWLRVADTGMTYEALATVAGELNLPLTKQEAENRGVTGLAKWRLRAASGGATDLLSILPWFFCAVWAHMKFKLGVGTKYGMILGISGLDGSGKSTLVDRLLAAYSMAGGEQPTLIHLLPGWIPLPHKIFRRKKTQSNYTRPYSEPPVKSRLSGGMRLGYYLGAFFIARLWFGVQTVRGRVLIMDRSVVDFYSDPTRSRIPVKKLPDWLLCLLLPRGRLFYLDTSPAAVVARKGELTFEKAQSLQAAYRRTGTSVSVTMLNGNETPDTVFRELLGHLSTEYMRRIEAEVVTK